MKEPLVSVIILNYNGRPHLKDCFNSLYNLDFDLDKVELILVDNNSQDDSLEFMENNYKDVKLIKLKKNYGFASGNNIGARKSNGKYIILLNNDTTVDKNWLSELVKVADSSKEIGIVASKIYYFNEKNIIDFAGSYGDRCLRTNHAGRNKPDSKAHSIQRNILYPCGASMLIKKELYSKIGLFDPAYFIYCEDLDVGIRSWICGYKVVIAPQSKIWHKINRKVINPDSLKKSFLLERNKIRTIIKNYEFQSVLYLLPAYIIKKLFEIAYRKTRLKNIVFYLYSIFRSIIWNIKNIRSLIKYRSFIQRSRIINDKLFFKILDTIRKRNFLY
ncbi:MAG: glycosyltransferase family 2 protein [Promethearchaeota archaeon]